MIVKTGTDLSYLNYGNNDLTGQVTLSQIITANDVTDMRYMYANCPNITSVTAYEYIDNRTGYTYSYSYQGSYINDNIKYAYKFNYSYTYTYNSVLKFEQPKTGFVKNMSHMFANCYSLTEANLAYMDFSECTDMQGMFDNCYNLETVIFGRYACNALLHLQDIFSGCYSLNCVYVPFELKDNVSNIIGHTGLHSYFYNANYNIEDTLPTFNIAYSFDNTHIVDVYTTLTVNNIGAFIVEADFDYHGSNECTLEIYGNTVNDSTYKLMFSYTTKTPTGNSSLELSDITEPFTYTFLNALEYNLKAELKGENNELLKSISYKINNMSSSRYIDINTYLIYFSDDENGVPDSQYTHYEDQNQAQSKIILDTYNWFFMDMNKVKYVDAKTFNISYLYEPTYDSFNRISILGNELDDNYDGPQTTESVYVDFVYAHYFNN